MRKRAGTNRHRPELFQLPGFCRLKAYEKTLCNDEAKSVVQICDVRIWNIRCKLMKIILTERAD